MKKILLFIICFLNCIVNAQQVEWAKQYPPLGTYPWPKHIQASPIGGFAVEGSFAKLTPGFTVDTVGVFLYSMDSLGTILWGDTVEMKFSYQGYSGCQPSGLAFNQNGKLIAGINFTDTISIDDTIFTSQNYNNNFILIRYDAQGNKEWIKIFSKATLNDIYIDESDNLYALVSFKDTLTFFGNTFISLEKSDLLITKIGPNGNLVFAKQLHGNLKGFKIKPTPIGEITVMARFLDTLYFDSYNFWGDNEYETNFIIKTNLSSTVLAYTVLPYWSNTYTGDLEVNYEGKIIATVKHSWTNGSQGIFNVYDTAGNLLVQQWHGGSSYGCGYNLDNIAIVDTSGVWCFGSEYNTGDYGNNYDNWYNLAISKFDMQGNILMRDTFPVSYGGGATDITADLQNGLYVTGVMRDTLEMQNHTLVNSYANETFFTARINQLPKVGTYLNPLTAMKESIFEISPNPSSGIFIVNLKNKTADTKICVYDVLGNCVLNKVYENDVSTKINLSGQPKGIYFLEIVSGDERRTRKIIIE